MAPKESGAAALRLRLFGPLELRRHGKPLRGFESRKAEALLAYVILQRKPVARAELAELFWEGRSEARGRGNLSRVLHNLRALLPAGSLGADRDFVRFEPTKRLWVDALAFEELSASGTKRDLEAAAALYRGELLAGLDEDVAGEAFRDWLVGERERWRVRAVGVYERLWDVYAREGKDEEALGLGARWLEVDPFSEEAYRRMMELHLRAKRRSAALLLYERCRRVLESELGVPPSEETEAVYERALRGAGGRAQGGLPAPPAPLVGRGRDLRETMRRLRSAACRLLTLVGPGGIGKTRLALELAHRLAPEFPDGAWWVSMESVGSPADFYSTLVLRLAIGEDGRGDPRALVLAHLRDRESLLVLDGFEPALAAAGSVAEILARAPRVKILVTSRAPLGLPGEWLWDVRGLSVPKATASPSALFRASATRLFLEAARRAHGLGTPTAEEAAAIVTICRRLEGFPLAIELAAALTRHMRLEELVEELGSSLDLLEPPGGTIEGNRSVRSCFEQSWRLLSAEGQAILARLAVFRGSFSLEAARAVAGASEADLVGLVRHSLLRRQRNRFRMHELVRRFAEEKLRERPEMAEESRERHAAFFSELLAAQEARFWQGAQSEAMRSVRREVHNLRLAWSHAVAKADAERLARMASGLWSFYDYGGWFREAEEAFARAVERLRAEAIEADRRHLLRLENRRAWFLARLGRLEQALASLERNHELLGNEPVRDAKELDWVRLTLGVIEWQRGRYDRAVGYLRAEEEAAGLRPSLGTLFLPLALYDLGELERADGAAEETLLWARRLGEARWMAHALLAKALLASARGEAPEARRLLLDALASARSVPDPLGVHALSIYAGIVAYRAGRYAEARRFYEQSLRYGERIGIPWGVGLATVWLGYNQLALGERAAAVASFRKAWATAREVGSRALEMAALAGVGMYLEGAEPARARKFLSSVVEDPSTPYLVRLEAERRRARLAAGRSAPRPGRARAPGRGDPRAGDETELRLEEAWRLLTRETALEKALSKDDRRSDPRAGGGERARRRPRASRTDS